jgi:hypothetical protein
MNMPSRRKLGNQLRFAIILAGVLGLSELTGGSLPLTEAASPQPPSAKYSRINRTLPGTRTGQLKTVTDTTALIENVTYRFAPGVIIETQTGRTVPLASGVWQKRFSYPISVQYWLASGQITQMIVILPQ